MIFFLLTLQVLLRVLLRVLLYVLLQILLYVLLQSSKRFSLKRTKFFFLCLQKSTDYGELVNCFIIFTSNENSAKICRKKSLNYVNAEKWKKEKQTNKKTNKAPKILCILIFRRLSFIFFLLQLKFFVEFLIFILAKIQFLPEGIFFMEKNSVAEQIIPKLLANEW